MTPPTTLPMTPARRRALAVGGALAAVLIAAGALQLVSLVGWGSRAEERSLVPPAGPLVVDVGSGDLTLRQAEGERVRVRTTVHHSLGAPRIEQRRGPDGLLVLRGSCGGPLSWMNCSADHEVAVPEGVAVEVRASSGEVAASDLTGLRVEVSSGDIDVSDVDGSLMLRATSGDIDVSDVDGSVVLRTSSGGIRADGLDGDADARASSGDVTLEFDSAPSRVRAVASSGDVDIRLPGSGGGYRVQTETGSGDSTVDVVADPGSARLVEAATSSGDVTVEPR
ncbi:MAG: DUF4097 family beta strand repeat protein [Pseudonocardiaceae bacterium]|nr:DUF4097 family beta strand repeat protein [Pseudonocardiaceae bacterium]